MGTSTRINDRTNRQVYDCWGCGVADGTVRRRRCPDGWCPATQLCGTCLRTMRKDGMWAKQHSGCQAAAKAFDDTETAKNNNPHQWAKAAWGTWHTGTDDVLVLTRANTWVLVKTGQYDQNAPLDTEGACGWSIETGVTLPQGL